MCFFLFEYDVCENVVKLYIWIDFGFVMEFDNFINYKISFFCYCWIVDCKIRCFFSLFFIFNGSYS